MDLNKTVVVVWLATIMMLSSSHTTYAYSPGPPVPLGNLCSDMTPQHGGSPQTSQPPYTITASATCYTPGQAATGKKTRKVVMNICNLITITAAVINTCTCNLIT